VVAAVALWRLELARAPAAAFGPECAMRILAGLALAASLAACSIRIDDSAVFRPQPNYAPAASVEELSRWPVADLRAVVPDAEVEHGFAGAGEDRLAYTLVSKPGEHRPLIVYCGGNSGDRFHSGVFFALKTLPYGDVLLFDYPGYGDSPGAPSAAALAARAPALQAIAVERSADRQLVFWGHSLGGFICSRMARDTPSADGVILEATARNALEVGRAWRPWFAAPFVRLSVDEGLSSFDVADTLSDFRGPILILGAKRDDTLPVRLSRSLNDALRTRGARVTYVEFPRAEHLDITRQPEFPAAASSFFASLAGQQ
jgi:pimeloyl-ACP methyl ester carboxylesterase